MTDYELYKILRYWIMANEEIMQTAIVNDKTSAVRKLLWKLRDMSKLYGDIEACPVCGRFWRTEDFHDDMHCDDCLKRQKE